jgi:hypothetical protein
MPFDQNELADWNAPGVEPPQSKKDNGWDPEEKPPADWFNWFFNKTFKSLQSLFTNAQHREEKGQPNGYAALNADGKVVNADGSLPGGVSSVNNKTGAVTLSAADVGAETPEGAQEKADAALDEAKAYTDSAPEAMQRNVGNFNVYKSGKDSNGIFTTVDYKRPDGTLYARSVLSGGTSPQYTTRTITYFDTDGTTVIRSDTFTLSYDGNGDLVSEVKS